MTTRNLVAIFLACSYVSIGTLAAKNEVVAPQVSSPRDGVKPLIEKVTVRNAEFEIVKTIESGEQLSAFETQWLQKTEIKNSPMFQLSKRHFKLDIVSAGKSTRWLYETNGSVRVLTKGPASDYSLSDPKAFNGLLGVHDQ